MLSQIENILRENSLCVLCTVGGGNPHCSLMTYIISDDMSVVYMISDHDSKKFKNLLSNPNVSILVDTRQDHRNPIAKQIKSVTFEGIHQPLEQEEIKAIKTHLAQDHLELNKILNSPNCTVFGIKLKTFLLLDGPVDSYQGNL